MGRLPFKITEPETWRIPIVVSVPHCGVIIPDGIRHRLNPGMLKPPDDADLFVDELYRFNRRIGFPILKSVFCRWVIDLNRSLDDQALYSDGRLITGLVPLTNFEGDDLYVTDPPDAAEIKSRTERYYELYHEVLEKLISRSLRKFGHCLVLDAHSIRRFLPTIHQKPFPDLILGDNEGKSAHPSIISSADSFLRGCGFSYAHNHPFKGGFITRNYGRPNQSIHSIQLEMSKDIYMDDEERRFDPDRAGKVSEMLEQFIVHLNSTLNTLVPNAKK